MITVSIVSHQHGDMVSRLVNQLLLFPEVTKVILTLNVSEELDWPISDRLVIVRNQLPKGFGANHNAAFQACDTAYFCVLNPDVILAASPFPHLLKLFSDPEVALVGPLVVAPDGRVEDSIRRFPTLVSLLLKAVGLSEGRYSISFGEDDLAPDWIAGMFMLFKSRDFASLNGFDERFFLYYEDVDICARIWRNRRKVMACPSVKIVHDARRDSRKIWRYRRWHVRSLFLYLTRYAGQDPRRGGR
ncbi:glycosyltransferase [Rhizobium sp. YTU87027]|uniref:glycosyltransferase n=1 Tax=Rhizobium sp. YTU87027 TaxID=3417741 RepID=UPI003D68B36B